MNSILPIHIIEKIIEMSEPSIDIRIAFGIKPKRLDEAKCWRLWWLLKSHDGIVYNLETKSLHMFGGAHVVRRPISISYHTAGLWIFNDEEEEYTTEITCPCGCFLWEPSSAAWSTDKRVLFRGANPSRELTVEDAMVFGDLSTSSSLGY